MKIKIIDLLEWANYRFKPSKQYLAELARLVETEDSLIKTLNDKQLKLFKSFNDKRSEINSMEVDEHFVLGFSIAVQLITESLNQKN